MILTGENRRTRRKIYPGTIFSIKSPTWTEPDVNSVLRCESTAYRLSEQISERDIVGDPGVEGTVIMKVILKLNFM
jgi:hypothetical protein